MDKPPPPSYSPTQNLLDPPIAAQFPTTVTENLKLLLNYNFGPKFNLIFSLNPLPFKTRIWKMPPGKARDAHAATYNQDNISKDEALASMTTRIDMLAVLIA